ncbi:hypothetical protein F8172_21370 [Bacillus cereus]|uniref:Uncharacterized protein n=1 Tax=Bacillus cereus TaxID=1396 RepID=A0A9W7UVC4_BACCE|nr:hypothetical protein F8172_21370 [Bacillus cereus]MBG0970118.1 hypothetical protein [Bacillus sp. SRB3LM]OXB96707.1 hypothetical protein CGQ22_22935 [Bacillus sp. M13(2017)]QCY60330.1 hypothetical protein FHE73_05860 [Bacillus thuringiensis]KAB2404039.1 hypothetical protein F8170_18015 [Bacillus cereus]
MEKIFPEPVFICNSLFFMLKLVKNYRECVLVSVEELVQQEHLLRMIVNNYKFVFSVEMGKSFLDRP